ncbi:MAG: hypothetical protein Q8N23_11650 [Archangium sp.]|nr:hypothetical protein [Archangium sp.]MDP3573386.1 hypothetical protein [Archangium sp.]
MGIEDEKTRPATKSVKRKPAPVSDVAHLTTRKVKSVKRKPADPYAGFLELQQALVLKRAELANRSGGKDNGWLFRETNATEGLVSFVMSDEPLLATLSRLVVEQGYDLDVMCAGTCVALLRVQRVISRASAKAHLFARDGTLLAELAVHSRSPRVECIDEEGRTLLRMEEAHPTQYDFLAGKRLVGSLLRITQPGILLDSYELDLSFFEGATGLERLIATAAVVTEQVWKLAMPNDNRRRHGGIDLVDLFD